MGALASVLESKGYGHQDALNAENGPRAAELAREYGVGSGASGGGGGNPVDQLIQNAIDAYTKQINDYTSKGQAFDKANPFVFDDVLAAKAKEVGSRLDPYYNQTLNDYLHGVTVKRTRSLEDEQTTLTNLNKDVADFTGKSKDLLTDALDKSKQGYNDAGAFFSGATLKNAGEQTVNSQQNVSDYMKGANRSSDQTQLNTNRNLEDLSLLASQKQRDLNTQKYTDVQTQALNETGQAQAKRDFERNQYIGGPYAQNALTTLPNTIAGLI